MVMVDGRLDEAQYTRPQEQTAGIMAGFLRFLRQIMVPTLVLCGLAVMAFVERSQPVSLLGVLSFSDASVDPGPWFTMGHIWLLAMFGIVNLTSRRYGAGAATGSVILTAAVLGGVWAYAAYGAAHVVLSEEMIGALVVQPMAYAMALSLVTGLLVAVVVFDLVRGRPWWKAPLLAPLIGGAVFVGLFHTLGDTALTGTFVERAVVHFAVVTFATLVMLVIYHMLRSLIPPAPGYGGA